MKLPDEQYNIIYADPPWAYRDKAHAGGRGAEYKYSIMTDAEIMALPVSSIAADNSALFLWATFPRLDVAMEVIRAWGFDYKTAAFVWIKTYKMSGKLFMGMGNYTRANAEVCLLGVKGKLLRIDAGVHSVVMAPAREHSRKPDEVRERIVQLFGDVPRIELFARERAPGWDAWGNELQRGAI